jgi:Leucine-rich repeat (LRR) protein
VIAVLSAFLFLTSILSAGEFVVQFQTPPQKNISAKGRQSISRAYSTSVPLFLDRNVVENMLKERPEQITLSFPGETTLPSSVSLRSFSVFTPEAKIYTADEAGNHESDFLKQWVSYKGTVDNDPRSIIVITVSRFGLNAYIDRGMVRYFIQGVPGNGDPQKQLYALAADRSVKSNRDFRCGVDDPANTSSVRQRRTAVSSASDPMNPQSKKLLFSPPLLKEDILPVNIFSAAVSTDTIEVHVAVEGDYPLYQAEGNNADSVTVLMATAVAEASAVYERDLAVVLKIPFSRVWTSASPFAASDIFTALRNIQSYWKSTMGTTERTTVHLFSSSTAWSGSPGVAGYAYLNSLCSPEYGYGATSVVTGGTDHLMTFAHELGHNFGSYHTHSCLWPNGPIDHCSEIEGGCDNSPIVQTEGTIMSYCTNRKMEFHPTCVALMRRVVETSWCAPSVVPAPVAQSDSTFIEALYASTGGANWTRRTNWDSISISGRYGISVRSGRVVSIDLPANNLQGSLPDGLTNLTALRRLNLSGRNYYHEPAVSKRDPADFTFNGNYITGQIPAGIDQLASLEYLDLSNNGFSGSIPASVGNLTELRWLNLSENFNITGTIPATIGNLPNLEVLDLSKNSLMTGNIPAEITTLPQLRVLILSGMRSITDSIPSTIGNLTKLYILDLDNNALIGSLPNSIVTMQSLEQLNVSYNQLTGAIPDQIGNLHSLNTLALNDNQFSRTIPVSIANLNLGSLNLSRNQLTGTIPGSIGEMQLLGLYLSENKLSGTIPVELGKLSQLIEFEIQGNQLTGTIPDTLRNLGTASPGDFGGLIVFRVGNNLLTGAVPAWLMQKTHLSQLDLGGNNFSPLGTFPQWILDLPSPYRLLLSNMGITGTIPLPLAGKISLGELDLSNNQFTGTIPAELGGLTSLTVLRLSGNQLTGSIPKELGSIPYLNDLRLSNNQLTGMIPKELGNSINLAYLYLDSNQLTGKAPAGLTQSPVMKQLLLSNNDLEGLPDLPGYFAHSAADAKTEIENNRLSFADILPYVQGNLKNLLYAPQKLLSHPAELHISSTSRVTLTMDPLTNGNTYQWFKNGNAVDGATSSAFVIPSLSPADTGVYTARAMNAAAPLLTLERNPYHVMLSTSNLPGDITLDVPRIGAQGVAVPVQLHWNFDASAVRYRVEADSTGEFTNLLFQKDSITDNTVALPALPPASMYYWRVRGNNAQGNGSWSSVWSFKTSGTPLLVSKAASIPAEYALDQNYPNPFNPSTTISFDLPANGIVRLSVYTILGQETAMLINNYLSAGRYSVQVDMSGKSSGVYLYHLETEKFSSTKRMMLIK